MPILYLVVVSQNTVQKQVIFKPSTPLVADCYYFSGVEAKAQV